MQEVHQDQETVLFKSMNNQLDFIFSKRSSEENFVFVADSIHIYSLHTNRGRMRRAKQVSIELGSNPVFFFLVFNCSIIVHQSFNSNSSSIKVSLEMEIFCIFISFSNISLTSSLFRFYLLFKQQLSQGEFTVLFSFFSVSDRSSVLFFISNSLILFLRSFLTFFIFPSSLKFQPFRAIFSLLVFSFHISMLPLHLTRRFQLLITMSLKFFFLCHKSSYLKLGLGLVTLSVFSNRGTWSKCYMFSPWTTI